MIRKSGNRFSLGTNAKRLPGDHAQTRDNAKARSNSVESHLAGLARGLHGIAAGVANQRGVLPDRQRFADEITLHRVAALLREEPELLLGFHALGDDRHLQAVAKVDHRPDDRRRLWIAPEID